MPVPHSSPYLIAAMALLSAAQVHASPADRYLTWETKAARAQAIASVETPPSPSQPQNNQARATYGVPTSPYGQVGNPYRSVLDWPSKQASQQAPQQVMSTQPLPQMAVTAPPPAFVPSMAVPRPVPRPQPVTVASVPGPSPEVRQAIRPEPMREYSPEVSSRSAPQTRPQPTTPPTPVMTERVAPAPVAAPVQPPVAPAVAANDASGYQVPATSKYAARIAASRAAHAQSQAESPAQSPALNQSQTPAPVPATAPIATPTVPAETQSLASREADDVFIPGEQITNAMTQEPRRYSLHRQFGLQPDRIQVDPNATGAILETTFNALEPDDKPDDAPEDSDGTP